MGVPSATPLGGNEKNLLDENDNENELKTKGNNNEADRLHGVHMFCVHSDYWEDHIIGGYRSSDMSPRECIQSIFHANNETMNVWTHLVAFLLFAVTFARFFLCEVSLKDPMAWPLLVHAVGILSYSLMSSLAHTFQCMSVPALHACFCVDYAAICIYTVACGQVYYWYTRPLDSDVWLLRWPIGFAVASVTSSIVATFVTCYTRYNQNYRRYKAFVIVAAFLVPFIVNTFPYFARIACLGRESYSDCESTNLHQLWLILTAALCYSFRVPERFHPGWFDRAGHSHNLMHVFMSLASWFQFDTARCDKIEREEMLRRDGREVTFWNCPLFLLIAFALNLLIARWFSQRIKEKLRKGE